MDPCEIEFIAEKTGIEIVPNFTNNAIHLIAGDVGPFRAGLPIVVPLWLAVNLKQRQKCRIMTPEWMKVDELEAKKEEEKNSKFFTRMPHEHYLEVTNLLLRVANDDIIQAEEIRILVKDLWDMRIAKLRSSVDTMINEGQIRAALNHLTQMEINSVRPLLPDALNMLQTLQQDYDSEEDENSQNTTRQNTSTYTSSLSQFSG